MNSDNPSGADDQQETILVVGSSETVRQASLDQAVMRQSDPHGDMGSQAEMT